MLRTVLSGLVLEGAALSRQAAAQTLVSLRRFSSEDGPPSTSSQSQPAAPSAGASPKGVQQWRQWVDAKIGEKVEGRAENEPAAAPAAAAAPQPTTAEPEASVAPPAAAAPAEQPASSTLPAAAAAAAASASGPAPEPSVEEELMDLLRPQRTRPRRSVQQEIFDIVVPPSQAESDDQALSAVLSFKQLGQAKEAPRLFPGGANKADEVSPDRIHPYRLFYPGQLYTPQDLDPYQAKAAEVESAPARAARQVSISRAEVEAKADFRNAQFLTSFVTEAGKLVPRRRTKLQQKLHRHLCRQVKVARIMAILPPDSRLPQFHQRRHAPRGPAPRPPQAAPGQSPLA